MSARRIKQRCLSEATSVGEMPMAAGWYWYLGYLRSNIRNLQRQHLSALKGCHERVRGDAEQDEIVQRLADVAVESIDRHQREMESVGVLTPHG